MVNAVLPAIAGARDRNRYGHRKTWLHEDSGR
jgi:hypothetical protein